jgi:type IV pilus assembly protein PilB
MRIRRKDEHAAEPTGDTLILEREGGSELGPFSERALNESMPAFEAPPVDTAPVRGRLGQVLVSRGVVTETQVAAALKAQGDSGKRLGEVLVDIGALDERGLADALADFFGMPVTDLKRDTPEPSALALVPAEVARENLAIPLRVDDDALHVAVAQPSDDLRSCSPKSAGTRSGCRWRR